MNNKISTETFAHQCMAVFSPEALAIRTDKFTPEDIQYWVLLVQRTRSLTDYEKCRPSYIVIAERIILASQLAVEDNAILNDPSVWVVGIAKAIKVAFDCPDPRAIDILDPFFTYWCDKGDVTMMEHSRWLAFAPIAEIRSWLNDLIWELWKSEEVN